MIFAKAHALGNDFILIKTKELISPDFIKKIADRKTGIGADQILQINEFNVNIWNQDGSIAKMCMNGLRCLAKWLDLETVCLNTISGKIHLSKIGSEIKLQPEYQANIISEELTNFGHKFIVNVGNLHEIYINSSFIEYPKNNEHNVSCVWKENEKWHARTWEIGAETLACGSAAFSIASVLNHLKLTNLDIYFPLGPIKHIIENGKISQIGPAHIVAEGKILTQQ